MVFATCCGIAVSVTLGRYADYRHDFLFQQPGWSPSWTRSHGFFFSFFFSWIGVQKQYTLLICSGYPHGFLIRNVIKGIRNVIHVCNSSLVFFFILFPFLIFLCFPPLLTFHIRLLKLKEYLVKIVWTA